jgi:hypothetical protein
VIEGRSLPTETIDLRAIVSAALRSFLLIAVALLLILVLLPAAVGAAAPPLPIG